MKTMSRLQFSMPNLFTFYLAGAELGIPYAAYKLGDCYLRGRMAEKDDLKALQWFERAAEKGLAPAHHKIAFMRKKGLGGRVDLSRASQHLELASSYSIAATHEVIEDYLYQDGDLSKKQRAKELLERLGRGSPYFVSELSLFLKIYDFPPPVSPADRHALYVQADLEGIPEASLALGLLAVSRSTAEDAMTEAYHYFSRAAVRGNTTAAILVATMKIDGKGCEADVKSGFFELNQLWRENRSYDAAYRRACYYMSSHLFPRDLQTALLCLEVPAHVGHAASCHAKAEILLALGGQDEETFEKVANLKLKAFKGGFGRGLAEMARHFDLSQAPFSPAQPIYHQCLELAASLGDCHSSYKLARFHLSQSDDHSHETAGLFWAAAAFDENLSEAGVLLAKHLLGHAPEKIFFSRSLLMGAAEAGNPDAARILGDLIYKPNSSENHYAAAYYLHGAELGDLASQEKIAMMYFYGDGIPPNRKGADYWYAKAAAQKQELSERQSEKISDQPKTHERLKDEKDNQVNLNSPVQVFSKNMLLKPVILSDIKTKDDSPTEIFGIGENTSIAGSDSELTENQPKSNISDSIEKGEPKKSEVQNSLEKSLYETFPIGLESISNEAADSSQIPPSTTTGLDAASELVRRLGRDFLTLFNDESCTDKNAFTQISSSSVAQKSIESEGDPIDQKFPSVCAREDPSSTEESRTAHKHGDLSNSVSEKFEKQAAGNFEKSNCLFNTTSREQSASEVGSRDIDCLPKSS